MFYSFLSPYLFFGAVITKKKNDLKQVNTALQVPHVCFLSNKISLDSMVNEIENSDFILDSLGKTDYDGDMNAMHWESNLNNSNILVYGCSENPFLDIEHPLNDRIINVYKRLAENRTDFKNYLEMLVKNNYLLNPETQQSREIEFIKEAWSSWDWVYPYVHEKDNN